MAKQKKKKSREWWPFSIVLIALIFLLSLFMLKEEPEPDILFDDNDAPEPEVEISNHIEPECIDPILCSAALKNPRLKQCTGRGEYGYFCAALISKNVSFCDFLSEESGVLHCKAYVLKQPELCENSSQADFCYSDLATNWNRPDLCGKIVDFYKKGYCMAMVNDDISYCKNLDNDIGCIAQMAELNHNSSLCDECSDPEACRSILHT